MENFTKVFTSEIQIFLDEFNVLKIFIYQLWFAIILFGLASNTLNITVFVSLGLKDSVTVTLLFLSVSDLINLLLNIPMAIARCIGETYPDHQWPIDRNILYYLLYWPAVVFYDFSSFIAVFLAVVRCLCVARPLRFKSMFTPGRTVTILLSLFLAAFIFRGPVLVTNSLGWAVNPRTNATFVYLRHLDNSEELFKVNDIFNRNIVSWMAYITAITCLVILTSSLLAASRFRQSAQVANNAGPADIRQSTPGAGNSAVKGERPDSSLSGKDLQVVQSVTLICAVFIVSQLPFQTISMVRLFQPGFGFNEKTRVALRFANHISNTCGYLNASVNIFLYYRFNSRYRKTLCSFLPKWIFASQDSPTEGGSKR
ncbi:hypothetical protein EGW08_002975 [Elysia chlorotica]|uniref:G-protein coupled receptors family 1 profile domain-containing protein n=1 Tax=Elysia chlorotica TaxID=188477 RepID=A0A3S1BIP6_ELYCH|nr:hypothetical protein EGW08_002975 [Elysia chlorotica]